MIAVRNGEKRGQTEIGWLHSKHSFSFGEYHDPKNMGFRSLRVINDDIIEPGGGFGMHAHRDMEIITIVLEGALKHRDSLGNEGVIKPGDVQAMTAGRGIRHSEFNGSDAQRVHLIQIWIEPEATGLEPSYAQKEFPSVESSGRLVRVAGRSSGDDDRALAIHQDASIFFGSLAAGVPMKHALRKDRGAWVHVATGTASVNGVDLTAGDAVAVTDEHELTLIGGTSGAAVILFDLA